MTEDEGSKVSFWSQLRQRRVFRAVAAYAIVSFIGIQIADATFEALSLPASSIPWMLTVISFFFPFVVTAAWLFEFTSSGVAYDKRFKTTNSRREIALLVLLFLLSLTVAAVFGFLASITESDSKTELRFSREKPTIVVLPFDSYSKEDATYLGLGIAEQLASVLHQLTEFNVVGRTSSFLLAERDLDLEQIGEILGADFALEGSVVLDGQHVLITAQLIEIDSLLHVWSESYERDFVGIIDLEREITRNIALAMNMTLSRNSLTQLDRSTGVEAHAYDAFLRGQAYLQRPASRENLSMAIDLFRGALVIDSNFPDAETAECQAQLSLFRVSKDSNVYQDALATCLKVASRTPKSAEDHVAVGDLNQLTGNLSEAEMQYRAALRLDSSLPRAYHGLARTLMDQNKLEEAEEVYKLGIVAEPGFALSHRRYGYFLALQGRIDEAAEQFEKTIALDPDDANTRTNLGMTYFDSNRWAEAEQAWLASLRTSQTVTALINLATLYYYQASYDKAAELLKEAAELPNPNYRIYGKLGACERQRGNPEAAERAFNRAISMATEVLGIGGFNAPLAATLASYHANIGDFEQADAYLKRALTSMPEDIDVHYYAAIVRHLAGEPGVVDELRLALANGYPRRLLASDPLFVDYLSSVIVDEHTGEEL